MVEGIKSDQVEASPAGGVVAPGDVAVAAEDSQSDIKAGELEWFSKDGREDLVWIGMMFDTVRTMNKISRS